MAGLGAVLSEYPEDVVAVACDPRTGIARRSKWLPTIAEVSEFCEELMRPRREHEAWQRRVREQISEREAVFGKTVHGSVSNKQGD